MSILSQIIAYSPNKIDTEKKAKTLLLAEVPRSEMDNFNTPDLDQGADSILRPGETLEDDFDVTFRRPNAQGGMQQLVQPNADGSRPGYSGDFTAKQKQKITEAFPDIELNFNKYPMGVKKYLEPGNTNLTNKDYTKILRFKKKGFTTEMGEGKNTRGESYSDEGKRLSIKDQNKIKGQFELPTGEEWDFKTHKYGIKQAGRENLLARMARLLKEKRSWTVAADRGSTKGWMMLQMNRVYENEIKTKKNKLTYEPVFDKFGDRKIIVGFKDNTAAGNGKTYYGLNKYSKKNSTSWLKHGDYKQNQKLVDISKRALKQPNEVIMGLLEDKNFKGNNVKLNHLIHFLSGTEASSSDVLKNAISRHHQSGVAFGSATDDLALTTRTINNKIKGIEGRIANNKILPEDIQTLKNNNVYVRGSDGTLYGSGKKSTIGQFKQIESNVARSLESGVDFKGNKFKTKELLSYLEKLGCGKSAGGRIMFGNGTSCAIKGREVLEKGLKNGFKKSDVGLAQKILGSGRFLKEAVSLRGLFGPAALAFTVAAEAGIVGYDMLASGKSFREAVGDSVFNYALGDKTKIDSDEEFMKRLKNIKVGPQGYQRMGDAEIGKMLNFKTNLDDMKRGFDLYGKLDAIGENRKQIGNNSEDAFNEGAFQLDLNKQEDAVRADIRDYNKTGTPRRVTDYLLSDKAKEGADATAYANLLVKEDQLKNAGTGDFLPKVDQGIARNLKQTQYGIDNLLNPKKLDEFGEYFVSRPKSEQSYMMGLGYKEGGIASLNVKK